MIKITLPWPPRALSPNGRAHWAAKATATKRLRRMAWALALEAGASKLTGPFSVAVTHCPKTRGTVPDVDNCIAAFKAAQDGLADALGVNDRDLAVTHCIGPRCASGAVLVMVVGAGQ